MPLHLIKLCVGIDDVDQLRAAQERRAYRRDGRMVVPGFTRRSPRRPDEVTDGGSIYWVIKGSVRCRQRVLDFEMVQEEEGGTSCRLILDPELVEVMPQAKKPFQGWRYLADADAPRDLTPGQGTGQGGDLPPHLLAELRELGLL